MNEIDEMVEEFVRVMNEMYTKKLLKFHHSRS